MQRFDYNLRELVGLVIMLPLAVILCLVTERHVPWWFWLLAFGWMAVWRLLPIARVFVDDSCVRIDYLLPFRRSHRFSFDALQAYEPIPLRIRGKVHPCMVCIYPRGEKPITLWAAGTKGFSEMSEILAQRLPLYEPHAA